MILSTTIIIVPGTLTILIRFLLPQYWPTWIGLLLLRLLCLLPFSLQMELGRQLGNLAYYSASGRRRIAQINIGLAFPELPSTDQQRLAKHHFQAIGITLFETAMAWWASKKRIESMIAEIDGFEHVQQALNQGRGVFLLGGHYTTLDICGRLLSTFLSLQITYKPARNALFERFMFNAREKIYERVIESRNMRAIIKALKQGRVCWYAPDQDFGPKNTVFAPFMGVPTATITTTARIARHSDADVIAFWHERLPGGRGYRLAFSAPLKDYPSNQEIVDAQKYNQLIETQVRRTPEQYLWVHRRFKTRPPGQAKLYQKRR